MVDHMELLFQVLLQFGDSRKVFDIKEPDDMNEVISKIKSMFAINASSDLFLQEYEEEWNDWVDVEDVDHIKDRAKLRVHVRVDQAAVKEKHAVSFIYFKSEVINISFPSFLFTIKVIKCKSQYR